MKNLNGSGQSNIQGNTENLNGITNPNIQENTGSITSKIPQQQADSIAGVVQAPGGYVGGYFGNTQAQETEQVQNVSTTGYVGGFIGQSQVQSSAYGNIDSEDFDRTKLPVKRGFWSKVKSFLFEKEVELEISAKEEKVLTEIHDFLFQDISFKGFMNILKIGKDKK